MLSGLMTLLRAFCLAFALSLSACATIHAGDGHAEPRPFMTERDAHADVDAALTRAGERGTKALIVMGGNWCHDSRAFAAAMERPDMTALIESEYELVWVDVGMKVLNQDVAERFGLDGTPGTPTVVVARPDGTVLNLDDAPTWRNAASRDPDDIHAYFVEMASRE
ncbi:MAG: thioredoxin family protein [Litorimonas sp.]